MIHTYLVMWKYNCGLLWSSRGFLCDNDQITTRTCTHDSIIKTHGHFDGILVPVQQEKSHRARCRRQRQLYFLVNIHPWNVFYIWNRREKRKNMHHYNIIIKCYIFDELSYDFLLSVSDNQQRGDRIDKAF